MGLYFNIIIYMDLVILLSCYHMTYGIALSHYITLHGIALYRNLIFIVLTWLSIIYINYLIRLGLVLYGRFKSYKWWVKIIIWWVKSSKWGLGQFLIFSYLISHMDLLMIPILMFVCFNLIKLGNI